MRLEGVPGAHAVKAEVCHIEIMKLAMVVFPYGTALLLFHINWNSKENSEPLYLDNLRTWLYLIKRVRKIPGVFNGWKLGNVNSVGKDWNTMLRPEHKKSLGTRICQTLYENKPISLRALSRWLLSPTGSIKDIHTETRSYHHTTVVIDAPLNKYMLNEYLFHLRHAKGQINRPPPNTVTYNKDKISLDTVIQTRLNRYIGIAREGTVSLSCPKFVFVGTEAPRFASSFT